MPAVAQVADRSRSVITSKLLRVVPSLGRVVLRTLLVAPLATRCASQETGRIIPGDARVDASAVHAYTRNYSVYAVRSRESTEDSVELIGTLTETVTFTSIRGDTVLVLIRDLRYGGPSAERDSLTLRRHSLAPLTWRAWREDGMYLGGAAFQGRKVSYRGALPGQASDTILPRPAFFEGTETLLLASLPITQDLSAPLKVSMAGYYDIERLFTVYEATVGILRGAPAPVGGDSAAVVTLRFGSSTYWVRRNTRVTVQWEDPPGEGGFAMRFVLREH